MAASFKLSYELQLSLPSPSMSHQTPTRGLTATASPSTQPDAQTFPAMEQLYHNQTPQDDVCPDTGGSSYSDLDCNHQQYPGASPTGNEARLNNDQAFLTDMGVFPGFVNQYQPTQYASQQNNQSQVIPTVPVMPPSHPAAYPASPGGTANLKTRAQAQTTSWNFANELHAELCDDFSLQTDLDLDLNTRASALFVDIWTSQAAQAPKEQKYFRYTGHSVELPVDLTSSPPPRYMYTSTSPKATKEYGYSQYDNPYLIPESGPQWGDAWCSNDGSDPNIHGPFNLVSPADTKPKQEVEAANTRTPDTANVVDLTGSPPPAYTAANSPFYQPRPQSSPQNNAVRGLVHKSEKDLSTLSDFINNADIKQEQKAQEDGKDENNKEEEKQEHEVKQECEEEQLSVKEGYPTPYSTLPTLASTPSQQPGNEEAGLSDQLVPDNFLELCEDVWQNEAKPAIAAMLSKRKHNIASWDDRVEFVMQCLDDLTEINSEDVYVEPCGALNMPPSPPNSKRRRDSEAQDERQSEARHSKRRRLDNESTSTSQLG